MNVYLDVFVPIYLHITFSILIVYYISLICMGNIYTHLYVYDTNIITYLSVKCCTYLDFHINNSLFKYEVLSLLDSL